MTRTDIEWCDFSVNPIRAERAGHGNGHACVKWGPDCENCYAERINKKFGTGLGFGKEETAGVTFAVNERALSAMASARGPGSCFVGDMSDYFQTGIPEAMTERVLRVCHANQRLDWSFLTKRTENLAGMVKRVLPEGSPNIWFGMSAGNNETFQRRRHAILQLAGSYQIFLSYEPAIGPIELFAGTARKFAGVIAGGETGAHARPSCATWLATVRDVCKGEGVPFFFKAWGGWRPADYIEWSHTAVHRRAIVWADGKVEDGKTRWERRHDEGSARRMVVAEFSPRPLRKLEGAMHEGTAWRLVKRDGAGGNEAGQLALVGG